MFQSRGEKNSVNFIKISKYWIKLSNNLDDLFDKLFFMLYQKFNFKKGKLLSLSLV